MIYIWCRILIFRFNKLKFFVKILNNVWFGRFGRGFEILYYNIFLYDVLYRLLGYRL